MVGMVGRRKAKGVVVSFISVWVGMVAHRPITHQNSPNLNPSIFYRSLTGAVFRELEWTLKNHNFIDSFVPSTIL
jgi:small basic protein